MSPIVWQYVGYFCGPLALVLFILLLWRRRELRRTKAVQLCGIFREWKIDDLADLCLAYTVGNYFGADSVTRIIHRIIDRLQTEGAPSVFRGLGWKMVEVFIAIPEDLKALENKIAAARLLASKTGGAAALVQQN